MIGIGQEGARFARAMQDAFLRKRLMAEYAAKSKACGWAAVLQAGIAGVLFFVPSTQSAHCVFLCVSLGFLLLSFRLRRDFKLLKLADQNRGEGPTAA